MIEGSSEGMMDEQGEGLLDGIIEEVQLGRMEGFMSGMEEGTLEGLVVGRGREGVGVGPEVDLPVVACTLVDRAK